MLLLLLSSFFHFSSPFAFFCSYLLLFALRPCPGSTALMTDAGCHEGLGELNSSKYPSLLCLLFPLTLNLPAFLILPASLPPTLLNAAFYIRSSPPTRTLSSLYFAAPAAFLFLLFCLSAPSFFQLPYFLVSCSSCPFDSLSFFAFFTLLFRIALSFPPQVRSNLWLVLATIRDLGN